MYYDGAVTPFQQANKQSAVMSPRTVHPPQVTAQPLPSPPRASFCRYVTQTEPKLILSQQHCLVIGRTDVDGRRNHDNESTIGQSGRSLVTKISPSTGIQWRGDATAGRIGERAAGREKEGSLCVLLAMMLIRQAVTLGVLISRDTDRP